MGRRTDPLANEIAQNGEPQFALVGPGMAEIEAHRWGCVGPISVKVVTGREQDALFHGGLHQQVDICARGQSRPEKQPTGRHSPNRTIAEVAVHQAREIVAALAIPTDQTFKP